MKRAAVVLLALGLAGCVSPPPDVPIVPKPGSDKVRIFRKSDPPATCREIKRVRGEHGAGCSGWGRDITNRPMDGWTMGVESKALVSLRNAVVDAGGNAVMIDAEQFPDTPGVNGCGWNFSWIISGIAYSCPDSALEAK